MRGARGFQGCRSVSSMRAEVFRSVCSITIRKDFFLGSRYSISRGEWTKQTTVLDNRDIGREIERVAAGLLALLLKLMAAY